MHFHWEFIIFIIFIIFHRLHNIANSEWLTVRLKALEFDITIIFKETGGRTSVHSGESESPAAFAPKAAPNLWLLSYWGKKSKIPMALIINSGNICVTGYRPWHALTTLPNYLCRLRKDFGYYL